MKLKSQILSSIIIGVLFLTQSVFLPQQTTAQNVGINSTGAVPNSSAMLDITSNNTGLLVPRLALVATNNAAPVTAPATSLLVYNTATAGIAPNNVTPGYYFWDGTKWVRFQDGNAVDDWHIDGNAGTVSGTDFIGTTDSTDLDIRTDNIVHVRITAKGQIETVNTKESVYIGKEAGENNHWGWQNTVIGQRAFYYNEDGSYNTAIGYMSLYSNITGHYNLAIGSQAAFYNDAHYNTAIGDDALFSNTDLNHNIAIGVAALFSQSTSGGPPENNIYNLAIGDSSLFSNQPSFIGFLYKDGAYNTAIGHLSLFSNTTGSNNTANGFQALYSNTIGSNNTANGVQALYSNTTGNYNVAIGNGTLYYNTTKSNLVAIGDSALYNNSRGIINAYLLATRNTAVGAKTLYSNEAGHSNTAIGYMSLYNNVWGNYNTASGSQSLYYNRFGHNNTANGYEALYYNEGNDNTASGYQSLYSNYNGRYNTASGSHALYYNKSSYNTAMGYSSLYSNTTASHNIAIGSDALYSQSFLNGSWPWDSYNIAIGDSALFSNQPTSISNGVQNTAIGHATLCSNTTGHSNIALGYKALYSNKYYSSNIAIGYKSMYHLDSASYNTAIGNFSLYYNHNGFVNTAIGYKAMEYNVDGHDNTALGAFSLNNNISGKQNTAIGRSSLTANTTGNYNVSVGLFSSSNNTIGSYNSVLGWHAMSSNTTANNNIAIGAVALLKQSYNNSGIAWNSYNIAIGDSALFSNQPTSISNGVQNTAIGHATLCSNTTGHSNIALGYKAADNITTGSNNIIIGNNIDAPINTASNQISIGNLLYGTGIDGSGTTVSTGNIGIGINSPTNKLDVDGQIRMRIGATAGYIIVSDANGVMSWSAPNTALNNDAWLLSGNSGTNNGTDFIGTTDNVNLDIRTNNIIHTRITTKGQIEILNTGNSIFIGEQAGENDDLSNNNNVFIGFDAGLSNTTGSRNIAIGGYTLYDITTTRGNVALGFASGSSLHANTQYSTFLGYGANAINTTSAYNYSTALGCGSVISASRQVRIGNPGANNATSIGGPVAWSTVSDGRFKVNVLENVSGLDFITKLRPVTYNFDQEKLNDFMNVPDSLRDRESTAKDMEYIHTGFIAQEVEQAAIECGFNFSGVDKPKNENDYYGLRYAEFVVPLVKSVQELNEKMEKENKELKEQIEEQTKNYNELLQRMETLESYYNE